jgi:hypothetical protein
MRLARPVLVLAIVALVGGACSSSSSSTPAAVGSSASSSGDGGGSGTSDAVAYMTSLCTSVSDWQAGIEEGNQEFQQSIGGGVPSFDDVKEDLQTYLQGAVDDTKALVAEIDALGAPDIGGGDQVATAMHDGLSSVATLFETMLASVSDLDTSDPAGMAQAMQDLGPDLQEAAAEIEAAFSQIEGPDIDAAMSDIPACADLG